MTDDLHRRAEQLADEFEQQGWLVTRRLEVEPAGAAQLLIVKPRTLRNWRSNLGEDGPPYRSHAGRTWYPIAELLEWIERKRSDGSVLDAETVRDQSAGA